MRKTNLKIFLIFLIIIVVGVTFVACSMSDKYNLTFKVQDSNGNWIDFYTTRVQANSLIEMPKDPEKDDYLFYGWYLDKSFNDELKPNSFINKAISENHEIYAKFVKAGDYPTSLTVQFDTNGGTSLPAVSISFGKFIKNLEIPNKDGYVFSGWYEDSELTKLFDKDNDRVRSNLKLYAKWEEANYTIEYVLDGGRYNGILQKSYSLSNPLQIDTLNFEKAGYSFAGIYLDEEFESIFEGDFLTNIKLYIKWEPVDYTIHFNMPEGVVSEGEYPTNFKVSETIVLPTVSLFGYDFYGWFINDDYSQKLNPNRLPPKNIEVYPLFMEKKLNITYNLNGGQNNSFNKATFNYFVENIILFNPTKKGYEFRGWYIDDEFTREFDGKNNHENIVLYAKWNAITYTVSYHLDGETNLEEAPSTYTFDTGLTIPIPTKEGYDFKGWYLDETLTSKLDINSLPARNIDLYPKLEVKRYKINYELNGGTNNSANISTYGYFDENITLYNPTKKGYEFKGWYFDQNLTSEFDGINRRMVIIVYAKWEAITYNIVYHYADATFDDGGHTTYTIESNFNFNSPDKVGYYFTGWYLEDTYNTFITTPYGLTGTLHLYAKFIEEEEIEDSNLIQCEHPQFVSILSSETKNICVELDNRSGIKKSSLLNTFYTYIHKSNPVVIINNTYLMSLPLNEKTYISFEFNDNTTYGFYITLVNSVAYDINIPNYSKFTLNDFVMEAQQNVTMNEILDVSIDGYSVNYVVNTNKIFVPYNIMDNLSIGNHYIVVSTDRGNKQERFSITNNIKMNPYNVNINVDSYPNMYVEWDCDANVDKYIVMVDGQRYDSISNASLFDGNKFILNNLGNVKVTSVIDEIEYDSELVTKPVTIGATTAELYLSPNYGYNFMEQKNKYITSYYELQDLILYLLLRNNVAPQRSFNVYNQDRQIESVLFATLDVCLAFDIKDIENKLDYDLSYYYGIASSNRNLNNRDFVLAIVQNVIFSAPEAFAYRLIVEKKTETFTNYNCYTIAVKTTASQQITVQRTISDAKDSDNVQEHNNMLTHFGNGLSNAFVFPYENNNKGETQVFNSIEYYLAIENGYKPIPMTEDLINLDQQIKLVLKAVLDESFNEYQTALALYEYLVKNVYYDYNLLETSVGASDPRLFYGYSSYYIEGVFFNKVAVCNAIAAAYSLMLNMMGIRAYKLTGEYEANNNRIGHAWVKMCIGGNWYLSDPTWGNAKLKPVSTETITYQYFLMNEVESYNNGHVFTNATRFADSYAGENNVVYYTFIKFIQNNVEYDYLIDSITEYRALIDYAVANSNLNVGEKQILQIYCNTSLVDLTNTNYKVTVYATELTNIKYIVITKK